MSYVSNEYFVANPFFIGFKNARIDSVGNEIHIKKNDGSGFARLKCSKCTDNFDIPSKELAYSFSSIVNLDAVNGMVLSNNGALSVDVSPGYCKSDDDSTNIFTFDIETRDVSTYLDSGVLQTNKIYAFYTIKNTTTDQVDFIASLSFTSPVMPSGFTKKRLIGSLLTEGSINVVPFVQTGKHFRMVTPILEVFDTSLSTYETLIARVPPNCLGYFYVKSVGSTTKGIFNILRTFSNAETVGSGATAGEYYNNGMNTTQSGVTVGESSQISVLTRCLVDSSSRLQYASILETGVGAASIKIYLAGFDMSWL